jgi:ferrous iron transport protein B
MLKKMTRKKSVPANPSCAYYLMGYPNSGKTELFNYLTYQRKKTGNWPGVTVSPARGRCQLTKQQSVDLYDLPGCCTQVMSDDGLEDDQNVAAKIMMQLQAGDYIINVIHACHLRQQLFLTMQLLEAGLPCMLVINQMDLLSETEKEKIYALDLSNKIGAPVCFHSSKNNPDSTHLKAMMLSMGRHTKTNNSYLDELLNLVDISFAQLTDCFSGHPRPLYCALRWLEGDVLVRHHLTQAPNIEETIKDNGVENAQDTFDVRINDFRYTAIAKIFSAQALTIEKPTMHWINAYLLHPFGGICIFLGVMYCALFVVVCCAQTLQGSVEIISQALLMDLPLFLIHHYFSHNSIIFYLVQPIVQGMITAINFFPILFFINCLMRFLEQSGYLARVAFVADKMMGSLNLSGRSLIPLLLGFGCNVPAVYSTKMLQQKHERIFLCMMIPFISCSARFTVYSVFAVTFFAYGGHNVIFMLYLLGVLVGFLTALLMKRAFPGVQRTPLLSTMPHLVMPSLTSVSQEAFYQSLSFIKRAGLAIIGASFICSILGRIHFGPHGFALVTINHSILAIYAKKMMFLLKPMGLSINGWPCIVALFTGIFAKEVVVGTLQSLYHTIGPAYQVHFPNLMHTLSHALSAFFHSIMLLPWQMMHPFSFDTLMMHPSRLLQTQLSLSFPNHAAVIAYLVFTLLYFPCASTMIAIAETLSWRWACYSVLWANIIAYCMAVLVYQGFIYWPSLLLFKTWF